VSNLINFNQNLTMSSLDISELCNKQHKHVLDDIRKMFEQLEIGSADFTATYTHPQNGQKYECFNLDKELTLTLVSGYSIKLRHKIIKRWQELEKELKNRPPIEMSLDEFANLYHLAMKGKNTYQRIQESIKTSEAVYGKKPSEIREKNPNVKYVRSEGNARNYYAAIELMVAQGADREKATEAVMSAIPKVQFEAKQLPIRANLTVTTTYQLELF